MMTLWPQYPQSQIHKCPSFRGRKYCTFSFLISATYLPLTSVALQKVKGTCFASLILFRQVETCSATHAPMKCLRLPQHARLKMLYVFMKIDIYFVHLWLYCRAVICGFCVFCTALARSPQRDKGRSNTLYSQKILLPCATVLHDVAVARHVPWGAPASPATLLFLLQGGVFCYKGIWFLAIQ